MHSVNRFQALFQQSAIAIQIYNLEGKCVEVNDAWIKLFQTKKSELDNYNVLEDPQTEATGVIACFRKAFAGEDVHIPENYYDPALSGKIGRARWLEAHFSPIRDDQGDVREVAILFSDITDRKNAEAELARSRDQLKVVFDHVPDGIVVQDKNYKIVYSNSVAAQMAGLNSPEEWKDQMAARDYHEYLTEEGEPFPPHLFPSRMALAGENPPETIIKFRNKNTDEVRVSLVTSRAILDAEGAPFQAVSVYRDITEKLRIETQLREALESKNLFFSVASHELRTPLTALKLNTQLMHLMYPQISQESITKLDRQVNRLSKLQEEMLDISRLSRGRLTLHKKQMNLSSLTSDVIFGFMDQLKISAIPLTQNIAENVTGTWDPDRLEQVVENLVTNAIRYAKKSPLYIRVARENDRAILEVCDQGPGIPPEDHAKIFNRFEQSRSFADRSGMGLGLYIVKEIVTLHGGTISVSNLNTGGARFLVELPCD
ncbi:MAG: PAS domain-containing sensor histidine kinase [Bdellovibrionota bacterium]